MKILFTLITIISVFNVFAQQNDEGKVINDTLFLNNGAKFVKGEKVQLGYGSNAFKDFEFVYLSPLSIAGKQKLPSSWGNKTMVIKRFELWGTKRTGKQFYLILGGGNLSPYWADIKSAMDNGEIIVMGINDKETISRKNSPAAAPASIADEITKLKKLYDDGTLTKEEYEAQKKKLLDKQ